MGTNQKIINMLDANQATHFARNLEYIKSRTYDIQYPDLIYPQLFPIATDIPIWADKWTFETYDMVGKADFLSDYAKDAPRADVGGHETTYPVHPLWSSFGYTYYEILAATQGKIPLKQAKANAARKAIEERLNRIAYHGDADHNLYGLFTHPNTTVATVPNGGGGTPQWSTKTPDEILADLNAAPNLQYSSTNKVEAPNTLLLPVAQWLLINNTARSATSDTTIAQFYVANNPFIRSLDSIIPVNELAGAGTGGVDVMVHYNRSPEKLNFILPEHLTFHPEDKHVIEYTTTITSKTGGLAIYYPKSVSISEDI